MLSMLATRTRKDILRHTEVAGIICRTTETGVGLVAIRRYSTTHTPLYETSSKDVLGF